MDLIVHTNTLRLLSKMFDRSRATEPLHKHIMNKPLCPYRIPELMPLPRVAPEEVGVSSAYIADFLRELASKKELDLHGVMIMKDGCILCDAVFGAYSSSFWHAEHSLSKSLTTTAVGMLMDEGKLSLEDKVIKILEKKIPPLAQLTHKALTVEHLLTMTSGVAFAENGVMVEENWLRAFFESKPRNEPGKVFHYNSLNSYVLSCIVREISGVGLREYLKPRLFDPLGITVMHWEMAPDGNEVGGWGLYMRREDVCKLAKLYLDGGVWNGKRILSERWIQSATTAKIATPESAGSFDYGFHIWTERNQKSFLFNGMFGQDMLAFPESNTAVITNGGFEQIFQQSVYYDIAEKYFAKRYADPLPLKRNRMAKKELAKVLTSFSAVTEDRKTCFFSKRKSGMPKFLTDAIGKTYYAKKADANAIIKTGSITGTSNLGLLPLIEQALRNRYTPGIASFGFRGTIDSLSLVVKEGNEEKILPIVPGKTVYTVLRLSDTDYHAAVTAETAYDEEGRGVLKLRLSFPEIASSRFLKIYFEGDALEVKMKEMPGIGLVRLAADSVGETLRSKKFVADMVSKLDPDILYYRLLNTVEPDFWLYIEK